MLASLSLFTNCRKVCDNKDAPTHELTQGQRDWGKPFVKNDVWRFSNASGYVRTYRVTRAEMLNEGGGGGKTSFCSTYFYNYFVADLERTDSVARPFDVPFRFQLLPANPSANKPFTASAFLGIANFSLPIDQVEDGQLTLAPATFGTRTYPAVLESAFSPIPSLGARPTFVRRVFFTKTEGLIRFEEFGGTVWNRL